MMDREKVIMKIIESRASFELSVVLTDIEVLIYREVFHSQMPVTIPELNNEKFMIKEITPYQGGGAAENAWHLVIQGEPMRSSPVLHSGNQSGPNRT
jgi:hypothetical protein